MNRQSDIKQLVRLALLASPEIMSRTDQRIYTSHPRTPDATTLEMPCIIIDITSGTGQYSMGSTSALLDLYVYTRVSDGDADALYHTVYTTLQMARLANATQSNGARVLTAAGYMYETSRPVTGYNDRAGAWYALGKWRAQVAG